MSAGGCPACLSAGGTIPATPAGHAEYMAALAEVLANSTDPAPNKVVADIAHAVALIGRAVANADAAYAEGLRQGKAAARHALALSMPGRRWRVGHDSGDVFTQDGDFDGATLVIELTSPDEARAVSALMLEIGGSR